MNFDENFLKEVGLAAMPEEQKEVFLQYVEEEVEVRIGDKIAENVDEEDLREFERTETDKEALAWLKENKPNYREIVDQVISGIKAEISRNREKILH